MKKLSSSQRYARAVLKKARVHNWYWKNPTGRSGKKIKKIKKVSA